MLIALGALARTVQAEELGGGSRFQGRHHHFLEQDEGSTTMCSTLIVLEGEQKLGVLCEEGNTIAIEDRNNDAEHNKGERAPVEMFIVVIALIFGIKITIDCWKNKKIDAEDHFRNMAARHYKHPRRHDHTAPMRMEDDDSES